MRSIAAAGTAGKGSCTRAGAEPAARRQSTQKRVGRWRRRTKPKILWVPCGLVFQAHGCWFCARESLCSRFHAVLDTAHFEKKTRRNRTKFLPSSFISRGLIISKGFYGLLKHASPPQASTAGLAQKPFFIIITRRNSSPAWQPQIPIPATKKAVQLHRPLGPLHGISALPIEGCSTGFRTSGIKFITPLSASASAFGCISAQSGIRFQCEE